MEGLKKLTKSSARIAGFRAFQIQRRTDAHLNMMFSSIF
jgi:hypothetical protein